MRLILLQLLVVSCIAYDWGYDDDSLYNCNNDKYYSERERRQILKLYPIDALIFVILGPVALVACLFIISTFILFPQARECPGDFLLGMSIWDMINTIHLMMSGWYLLAFDTSPVEGQGFCTVNGIMGFSSSIGDFVYNIAFVMSPLILLSNTLKSKKMTQIITHLGCAVIVISWCTYAALQDKINLSLAGVCEYATKYRQDDQAAISYGYITLLCIYIFLANLALYKFKRTVPRSEKVKELRDKYLFYYKRFLIVTSVLWGCQVVIGILNNLNCRYFLEPKINISLTIFNIISVILPILQSYVRSQDPILRSKIRKMFRKLMGKQVTHSDSGLELETGRHDTRFESSPNFLIQIQKEIKTSTIYSMLAGILAIQEQQNCKNLVLMSTNLVDEEIANASEDERKLKRQMVLSELEVYGSSEHFQKTNFTQEQCDKKAQIIIDDTMMKKMFDSPLTTLQMQVTYYSPDIFRYFLDKDATMINLIQSLDLQKNKENVQNLSNAPDGGKSGEFFFFSHDNQVIIKTMQWAEMIALRKRMFKYGNYLYNNPDSMISKIYGIYTFKRVDSTDSEQPFHVLIQRNISLGVPRQYTLRTFDMKGSEYDREVLSKKPNIDPSKTTLKDLDFFKTEQKIFIKPIMAEILLTSLQADADFFRQCRLIDYSLLVFKVDWGRYISEKGVTLKEIKSHITNSLYMIESTKEEGIFYHVAVIDYLQEWNVNKASEQVTKKIMKFNAHLDTSSQNPDVYSERFKKKLLEKILILD